MHKTHKTMKKLNFAILLIIALLTVNCQTANASKAKKKEPYKGYRFTFAVIGGNDTVMYLGNYYAGGTYAFDTARISSKGLFVFENKDRVLKPGLYFFSNPEGNYVEFAVYNNEKLDMQFVTDVSGWQTHMSVKGSKENELIFKFHQLNRAHYRTLDSAQVNIKDSAALAEFKRKLNHSLDSTKFAFIENNPNSMLALLMNATREPSVPTTDSAGNKLTDFQRWEYYMDHYFDYTRLDDDAMIRTPELVFHKRFVNYLDVALKNAPPETVIKYVDKLIEKARPSKENFRYLVHTIAEKYLQSNIMSYDAVYVHMVKKYVATGECDWMSPSTIDNNVKRAETWERLLIGKKAPQLIMRDDKGKLHSLYDLNHKYTLLIFWSPTCGHCKTVIPDLYNRFARYREKYDIEGFAILSEPDESTRPKWHEFIRTHGLNWINIDGGEANIDWREVYDIETTPQIYLLDRDKKIIAKKLSASSFEEVIKAIEHID